jgi:hypothetical protein
MRRPPLWIEAVVAHHTAQGLSSSAQLGWPLSWIANRGAPSLRDHGTVEHPKADAMTDLVEVSPWKAFQVTGMPEFAVPSIQSRSGPHAQTFVRSRRQLDQLQWLLRPDTVSAHNGHGNAEKSRLSRGVAITLWQLV